MSHEGTGPTGQEATPDRKALLLEQFNEAEAAEKTAATPPPDNSTVPPADSGRARDETGKFVAKEKIAAPDAQQVTAPAPTPAPQEPWMKAPNSWKKENWEGWTKIDPAYQRYIHQREQEMQAGVEPLKTKAQLADQLTQAAQPYMTTIQGLGLDLPKAVSGLMKVDHDLRTLPYEQKLQVLQNVARSYGIDLTGQAQAAVPMYDQGYQNIQNELLTVKARQEEFVKQQEAERDRAALDEIQRFKQTAEHFDELSPLMTKLLQGNVATGIQDAYDQALRLTPEIFDKVQAAKQAAADVEKRKAADEAAKRAKAAAVSVKSATPGAPAPNKAQDRRSMLREQLDGLSERL